MAEVNMRKLLLFPLFVLVAIVFAASWPAGAVPAGTTSMIAQEARGERPVALPNKAGSLKFAVLGNSGTGEQAQYQLAGQMAALHERFQYDLVILLGGNIYGSQRPQDFQKKFETPYKPLLDAGVKFHASLGREDSPDQRYYKLFNMGGKLYYTFSPQPDVSFFALDSNKPAPDQTHWLEQQFQASSAAWKIVFLHQPLYASGRSRGSEARLREMLEPLFVKYNVSVVLTGQDRFYERVKPQKGIAYFVVGSGGHLRSGHIDTSSGITAKAFDTDHVFLAAEILGDELYFNAISRKGETVDSGVLRRTTPARE
jgi:hypothetical protein